MHVRPSPLSGGYNQHGFRPRGPSPMPHWGARPSGPPQPSMGYDYQQRGMYPPPQTSHYHQSYGGYSQQPPPRGGFGGSWDQRSGAPVHNTPPAGGYDYYGQGGHSNENPPTNPMPNPTPNPTQPTPAPGNYNYGQSQPPSYGQPTQHGYGPGYNEPKYDNQAPGQQYYGQQPGPYGQQAPAPQSGYGHHQAYNKGGYGVPQEVPPSYGPPRPTHPGDPMYQGSAPSSYPTQQSYPYGSTAPSQPAPAYNQSYPASGVMDGYAQQQAAYAQHGGQPAPGYGQGQPAPAYTQPSQPGAYGQYPVTQQSYTDPASGNVVNYPYQSAPPDASYANANPSAGYVAAPQATTQAGYAQPPANPSGYYDQSAPPQAAYASQQQPAAPVGYSKSVSPQPAAYAGQYDANQVYGHH